MRIQTVTYCVAACIPLWCCSSNAPGTFVNPNIAGTGPAPAPAAGVGAGVVPTAGRPAGVGAVAGTGAPLPSAVAGHNADDTDAGVTQPTAGSSAAGTGAPSAGTGGAPGVVADACTATLEDCSYTDKEVGCKTAKTPVIPLSDGGSWGDNEIVMGPYGAYVEWNEGKDFATPVAAGESSCTLLAGTFGEPASVTADVLDLRGAELSLYTVFRPACMKDGEKYPVITWGNGTCGQTGGYAMMLTALASQGYVVFASNSRFTDGGNKEMLKALDFAKAANADPMNVLFGKLDLEHVGAMGHSQGASATMNAASDPRIKSVILWNGPTTAVKPFLAVSGERDITNATPASLKTAIDRAAQPGAWLFYHKVLQTGGNVTGHLTLMEQPERVIEPMVAWWNYQLKGDPEAKKMFVGEACGLCNQKDEYEFGQHNLP